MPATNRLALLLLLGLVACREPSVPRTPKDFYYLSKERLSSGQYRAAADGLKRATETDATGDLGRRALALRIALLSGTARGFQSIGEEYLAGYQQKKAPELRTMAMDYFSRARGQSLELLDALEQALKQPTTTPFRVDYWPAPVAVGAPLQKARQGQLLSEAESTAAERAAVQQGLAEALTGLTGKTGLSGAEIEVEPAVFFLGAAQELVRMTSLFRAEALGEQRLTQLTLERAATLARQAEQLAQTGGNPKVQAEAGQVLRQCEEALKKR